MSVSPANEFTIDKVPLEHIHIENVKVERVGLHAIELAICTDLGLPLIEIRLCACLAIQLFDVICARIEEIAVICLLVTRREATEDQDVFVRDLVEAATLQADPICILLYS